MKFVFPALWIGVFGYGTLRLWLAPAEVVFNGVKGAATRHDQIVFLLMLVVGTVFIAWTCLPLKRVYLTERGFLVSNYLEEAEVPFGNVERITQNRWLNIRPVTLHLRRESEFGSRIVFLPAGIGRLAFWREDELVAELRELVEKHSPEGLRPRAA
jgi:hypothetical protein